GEIALAARFVDPFFSALPPREERSERQALDALVPVAEVPLDVRVAVVGPVGAVEDAESLAPVEPFAGVGVGEAADDARVRRDPEQLLPREAPERKIEKEA